MAGATALMLVATMAGCGTKPSSTASPSGQQTTITVFAAASLEKSFTAIAKDFEAQNPQTKVTFSWAGSQTLVEQLANGAPADVLATANTTTMDKAVQTGSVTDPQEFTTNRLTLITPAGNPAQITGLDASLTGKNLVICAPAVPCGSATAKLAGLAGVTLTPKSEEQSVTDVKNKVISGQADAGLVYQTDAASAGDKVTTVAIRDSEKVVNRYPIALVKSSKNTTAATAFIAYVRSEAGQKTLKSFGFGA